MRDSQNIGAAQYCITLVHDTRYYTTLRHTARQAIIRPARISLKPRCTHHKRVSRLLVSADSRAEGSLSWFFRGGTGSHQKLGTPRLKHRCTLHHTACTASTHHTSEGSRGYLYKHENHTYRVLQPRPQKRFSMLFHFFPFYCKTFHFFIFFSSLLLRTFFQKPKRIILQILQRTFPILYSKDSSKK